MSGRLKRNDWKNLTEGYKRLERTIMTLQEVKDLAGKGEGLQIEFKKRQPIPKKSSGR